MIERREKNRAHWSATLDARNLGNARRRNPAGELALHNTLELRRAIAALGPLEGRRILALGDGPGLGAALLARRGARVIVVDLALARLHGGNRDSAVLAPRSSISFCAGTAEELPLADGSVDGILTKSVLIHTELPKAARELNRVLRPGGVAVFVEPTPDNPLVTLYRRIAAPAIWREITTYFGAREVAALRAGFPGAECRVRRSHFLAFLSSAFAFLFPAPRLLRASESFLDAIDQALFRLVPPLRRRSWFVTVVLRKRGSR